MTDADQRKVSRRTPQDTFADKHGRQGERRSRDQLRQDYEGAVARARAALLAHGMDSPEFAAAARATEAIDAQIKQFDRAARPGAADDR